MNNNKIEHMTGYDALRKSNNCYFMVFANFADYYNFSFICMYIMYGFFHISGLAVFDCIIFTAMY